MITIGVLHLQDSWQTGRLTIHETGLSLIGKLLGAFLKIPTENPLENFAITLSYQGFNHQKLISTRHLNPQRQSSEHPKWGLSFMCLKRRIEMRGWPPPSSQSKRLWGLDKKPESLVEKKCAKMWFRPKIFLRIFQCLHSRKIT